MKKICIAAIAALFLVASCGKKSNEHTHDDGTVHSDHNDTTKQEEVKVLADSTKQDTTAHGHSHDN